MSTPKKGKGEAEPLPPGHYEVVIERVRKIRNKPFKRVHVKVVDTDQKLSWVERILE